MIINALLSSLALAAPRAADQPLRVASSDDAGSTGEGVPRMTVVKGEVIRAIERVGKRRE